MADLPVRGSVAATYSLFPMTFSIFCLQSKEEERPLTQNIALQFSIQYLPQPLSTVAIKNAGVYPTIDSFSTIYYRMQSYFFMEKHSLTVSQIIVRSY